MNRTEQEQRKDVKVEFQYEVRKFRNIDSYRTLIKAMSNSFELDILKCKFYYVDEDGDKITVKDDYDLKAAFESFKPKIPKLIVTQFISTTKNDWLSEDQIQLSNFNDIKSVMSYYGENESQFVENKIDEAKLKVEISSLSNSMINDSKYLHLLDQSIDEKLQHFKSDITHQENSNNDHIDRDLCEAIDITYETISEAHIQPNIEHIIQTEISQQFQKLDLAKIISEQVEKLVEYKLKTLSITPFWKIKSCDCKNQYSTAKCASCCKQFIPEVKKYWEHWIGSTLTKSNSS